MRVWNNEENNEIVVRYGRGRKAHFSIFPNVFLQRHRLTNTYKGQGKPPEAVEVNFLCFIQFLIFLF